MLFERRRLIQLLLESLPEYQSHVRTNKSVQSIQEHDEGVSVSFEDGSVEHGSMVIGADGVHSTVRRMLSEKSAGQIEPEPFAAHTIGLYGHGPRVEAFRIGEVIEKHCSGWSFQTLTGRDRTYYFIYARLEKPTKERRRFTEEDAQEFAERYLKERILGDVTFGDLWDKRDLGNLRHLEQGVSRTWSRGRIVLIGDAAHKV
jgi:2-polyprenyl-6-methoxyphenol hydroxylase-like FAD-dependent oxidoreductase